MNAPKPTSEEQRGTHSGGFATVIILKGPPGVGKSYTARKLVRRLPGNKHAIVSVDELLHADQRRLCEEKAKLAAHHAALLARSFIGQNFIVVIEYTFDLSEDLVLLIDELRSEGTEGSRTGKIHVFHLSAALDEVKRRNLTRRDGTDALPKSPLERLYAVCEATAGRVANEVVLATTRMSTSKVVGRIIEQL